MAVHTEKYGVFAELVQSVASTPVSTDTNIFFIGASASGDLNKAYVITSMSDYATKLGGAAGDGYNLSEAAVAAFSIAGLNKVIMIPVSHSKDLTASDYIGSADNITGVYVIEDYLREHPTAVNVIVAPSISDSSVLAAIKTIAILADGHWKSFMLYDLPCDHDHVNAAGIPDVEEIVDDKVLSDEVADAVWGRVKTDGGYVISGAAVRACLMAKSDADYGVPARCGGNLAVSGMVGVVIPASSKSYTSAGWSTSDEGDVIENLPTSGGGTYPWVDGLSYEITDIYGQNISDDRTLVNNNGKVALKYHSTNAESHYAMVEHVTFDEITPEKSVKLRESDGTSLSADGVCSWINYGGGNWHTWGDHTSAFSAGGVSDERARFDNTIRMNIMITNRFQLKYRFEIDNPLTLQMRNDVINEQLDFLNGLVAIGALIGEPAVEFRADDNPIDNIAQGYFSWSTFDTPTIPAKHMNNKVSYTDAGLSVYYQAE